MKAWVKRNLVLATAVLVIGLSPIAVHAQNGTCTSTRDGDFLNQNGISRLVNGNCTCAAPGAARPNLQWNETHSGAGLGNTGGINELALANAGSGSAVGTYSIDPVNVNPNNANQSGRITYLYSGGGTYAYLILDNGVGADRGHPTVPGVFTFCQITPNTISPTGQSFSIQVKPGTCVPNC